MIVELILKVLLSVKYRKFRFKSEGLRCNYKSINSKFQYSNKISLGNDVWLGPKTELDGAGEIEIGNGVIFGPEVCVYSRSHNFDSIELKALPFDDIVWNAKVIINDFVWIGRRAIILPGVTIGKAAIVGAGAVVSKDVPDYAVVVGNPAKVVRLRNSERVELLLKEETPFVYSKLGHGKKDVVKIKK
ncbi:hypothetical protein AR687_00615 [Flavobacteriaceae bacterium CRH]|nr:hypothetical protein AR687_00615 [Flavobacteriaceae bacterium CRH]